MDLSESCSKHSIAKKLRHTNKSKPEKKDGSTSKSRRTSLCEIPETELKDKRKKQQLKKKGKKPTSSEANSDICNAVVKFAKGMYLYVQSDKGNLGRIHISEIDDTIQEGSRPLTRFRHGDRVKVRVLGVSLLKSNSPLVISHSHHPGRQVFDCSLKPSCLAGKSVEITKEFNAGEKVIGFACKFTAGAVYLRLSTTQVGKINNLNLSTKLHDITSRKKRFRKGHGYTATVLKKKEQYYLLSILGPDSIRSDSLVVCRLLNSRNEVGIIAQLPLGYKGIVGITDISDNYDHAEKFLTSLEGNYLQCYILDVDPNRKHANISLRTSRITKNFSEIADKELNDISDVQLNDEVRGFVKNSTPSKVYVTIGRNLEAVADIADGTPAFYSCTGSVVSLRITKVDTENNKVVGNLLLKDHEDEIDPAEFVPGSSIDMLRKWHREKNDDLEAESPKKLSKKKTRHTEESAKLPAIHNFKTVIVEESSSDILPKAPHLQVSSGFVWDAEALEATKKPDSSSDSDEDAEETKSSTKKKRRNKMLGEKLSERKLFEIEKSLMDSERQPETVDDYDRLILSSPNSSIIWLNYMTFHLQSADVDKARTVAERALKTISFREEQEKLNIWVALLNLENLYGTPESLHSVFQRALQYNEPLKVYKHLVTIYSKTDKLEAAEQLYNTMVRRFSSMKDIWLDFGTFLMRNGRSDFAHKLMERSLKSLPTKEHVNVISKFAQLEFKFGEAQRGKTMMESILNSYPKRTDVWSIYIDMMCRVVGDLDEARHIFERIITMKLSTKKMKFFFKKYLEFEKEHGTIQTVNHVKEKALHYVQNNDLDEDN